jgi:hypothetical protein
MESYRDRLLKGKSSNISVDVTNKLDENHVISMILDGKIDELMKIDHTQLKNINLAKIIETIKAAIIHLRFWISEGQHWNIAVNMQHMINKLERYKVFIENMSPRQ